MGRIVVKQLEREWLLALTRYAYEPPQQLTIFNRGLQVESVDWGWVIEEAIRHRVGVTVLAALDRLGLSNHLPKFDLHILGQQTVRNANRWDTLSEELATLVAACREAQVSIGVLRGPVVAQFYQEPHWRYFRDFDLLVSSTDLVRLDGMLNHLGYIQGNLDRERRRIIPATRKDWERQTQEKRLHAYLKFFPDDSDVFIIELHTRLFAPYEPYQLPVKPLLDSIGTAFLLTPLIGLPTLPVEEYLLELCIHIHNHAVSLPAMRSGTDLLLYRWLDLAVLVTRVGADVDWDRFFRLVNGADLAFPAAYGLYFLDRLYGLSVPSLECALPSDFEERCRAVWYFDAEDRYRQVTELSDGPLTRMFDRSCYAELAEWEQTAVLNETKVLHPHIANKEADCRI